MKQVILSIFSTVLLLGTIQAQVITISPNPANATHNNVFLNGDADLENHVSVTNATNDTLKLKWLREVPANCPGEWSTKVCDNSYCFNANQSSNYVPGTNVTVPFVLAPQETFSNFLLHVLPGTSAGCCEIKIHFSTITDPDNILETLVYDVRVNDPNCTISSTKEPSVLNSLQAFPNPSTGQFSINDNPLVKKVVVFNLLGRQVRSFEHTNGKLYDISGTPDGLYLVSMQDANGEVLKTVRITKQDLRP